MKKQPRRPSPPAKPSIPDRGLDTRRLWILRVAVLALFTLIVQYTFVMSLYFTGDEPSYVLSVISFLQDGDFNLHNNFERRDFLHFGYKELKPQFLPADAPLIPAEHGTAFPILIAPFYAAGGLGAIRLALIVLAYICVLLTAGIVDMLTDSFRAGSLAMALVAIAPVWIMQSSRIYPDVCAAFGVTLVIFLLARQVTRPGGVPSRASAFVMAFCVCILPLLYLKYGLLSAPLGVAALSMASFRKSMWTYLGGAMALLLGVVNLIVFRGQGPLAGPAGLGWLVGSDVYAQHTSGTWTLQHAFGRYWAQWIESHHGLAVYEPYMLLVLWAALFYIRAAKSDRERLFFGMAAATLTFSGMHAFWVLSPGWCYPGRYLFAAIPMFCVLIVCWAVRKDHLKKLRLMGIAAGAMVSLSVLVSAWMHQVQPDWGLPSYRQLFPTYWPSWKAGPAFPAAQDFGYAPFVLAATIVLTKLGAAIQERGRARRSQTHQMSALR
jgi:hypothetical protein